jgi:signal transduction histidine kinase
MTPLVPGGELGLADLSRLALMTLRAEELTVRDSAGRVVVTERRSERDPAAAAAGDPTESPAATAELRVPVLTGDNRSAGTLELVHLEGTTPPDSLVQAFARHLGVALAHHSEGDPDGHDRGMVFPWDDPDRLPEAINEITAQVTELVRPLTGATAVGITVWDSDRGILTALPGAFGATDAERAASITGPPTNMFSVSVRVFVTGQPYLSNQASGDPGVLQAYVELFDIHRILSVPLDSGNRRIGVLHLINKPGEFTEADIAAVEAVSPQIAIAVQLARSVARISARQRLEGILAEAAVAIASGRPGRESMLPAFDHLGAVVGAGLVALVPPKGTPLIRRTGSANAALEERLLRDARDLGTAATGAYPHRAGDPGWAALHAPVDLSGERVATLSVLRRTGGPFSVEEEDVTTRLARLVALSWTSERYQHQLAEITRLRERERIADGLHDRVSQVLFAAQLGLDTLLDEELADSHRERLADIRALLTGGDVAIREVIHQLAATPGADLNRRLRLEVESVEDEFGVAVHAEIPDDPTLRAVTRPIADAAAKVVREGTVNAAKHAGPCRIGVTVAVDNSGHLVVAVTDDGLGLGSGPAPAGHGLGALRRSVVDAGGELNVERPTGGFGTQVRARFPL